MFSFLSLGPLGFGCLHGQSFLFLLFWTWALFIVKKKHDDLLKIIFQTLHYGQVSLKKNYVCVFNRKKQYIKEKDKNKNILHDFIFYIHYRLNNKFIKLMRNLV
jgi:hypothetical protein